MTLDSAAILRSKPLLLATATLGASFLPFCDYDGMGVSLIGIHGIIGQVQQAMGNLSDAGASLDGGSGTSTNGLTVSLDLLLLLYIVPVIAALAIYFELTGGPGQRWVRLSGVASVVLPLLLPFLAWEMFKAFLPADIRSLMGAADGSSIGLTPGIGLWAIVLLGAAQTFLSLRRNEDLALNLKA